MKRLDLLFIIMISMIWGMNFVAIKWAVTDFPPMLVNLLRFSVVLILLAPFLRHTKVQLYPVIRLAILIGVFHFGMVAIAVKWANGVSAIAVVSQLSVPFATIFAIIILKEVVGLIRIVAIALSFIGVLVIGFDPVIFDHIDALFMMGMGTAVMALGTIRMRQLKDISPMAIQSWVALMAVVGSLILTLVFESGQLEAIQNAGIHAWGSILYSALLASILGHVGLNFLLQKYEVSVVSPYLLLMPVFAILAGIILLDEEITWRLILGSIITLLGVFIITIRNNKRTISIK